MAVLAAWHPDVEEFIDAKRAAGLENFNLSVAAPDALFRAAAAGEAWELRHPRSGEVVRRVDARALLERIAASAWASGEPGLVFLDRVEAANPTPDAGRFEAVNPCGLVDEGGPLERVEDAGQVVLDRQHEAGGELAVRAPGVHERRRVGQELERGHARLEALGGAGALRRGLGGGHGGGDVAARQAVEHLLTHYAAAPAHAPQAALRSRLRPASRSASGQIRSTSVSRGCALRGASARRASSSASRSRAHGA